MTKTPTTDTIPDTSADLTPPDPDLTALMEIAARATPGPWCAEQCGEKCDAPVVGIAWREDDTDCKNPLSGWLQPYDDQGHEVTYHRETIAYEIEDCDGCSASANAAHIAAFSPDTVLTILTRLVAAEARLAKAEARVAVLEGEIARIGRVARSDGTRNFDGCILDLQYIDDRCRALASASGEGE